MDRSSFHHLLSILSRIIMVEIPVFLIVLLIVFFSVIGIIAASVFVHLGWGYSKNRSVVLAPFVYAVFLLPPTLIGLWLINNSHLCLGGIIFMGWLIVSGLYMYNRIVTTMRNQTKNLS